MCKGSQTTTSQTTPNSEAMAAYQGLLGSAQGVAQNNPFQTYGGQFVAPVNQQQYAGIGNINQYSQAAQPYIGAATGYALQGANPITQGQIQQYENPYIQQVVGATEAQFNNQNAQQQQQVLGNAAAQGALGGDRTAVAQANLAGQQQLAQAPVIAGLESQGYSQGVQTALAEQQAAAQGAYSLGNLGVAGQQAALSGAGAQVQAGTLEQQTQQQQNAALYNQFLMQQAFPYQQEQWLAGIDTGVGSQMGGTSTTTGPPPNFLAQLLGLGTAGVGAGIQGGVFKPSARGGRIAGFDSGGNVAPYGVTGPMYGGVGFMPQMSITHGPGAPKAPSLPGQPAGSQSSPFAPWMAKALTGGSGGAGAGAGTAGTGIGDAAAGVGDAAAAGDATAAASAGAGVGEAADLLPLLLLKRGGGIHLKPGFDFGGPVTAAGFGTGSMVPRWSVPTYDDGGFVQDADGEWRTAPDARKGDFGLTPNQRVGEAFQATRANPSRMASGHDQARMIAGLVQRGVRGYDDGGEVISLSPDDLPQSVTPQALAAWRSGVDTDRSVGASAQPVGGFGGPPDLPPEITAGASQPEPAGVSAPTALGYTDDPNTAGVAAPAAKAAKPGMFTPESGLGQALMAAGFGMMASKSPFLGTAIGEGGLSGVHAYSAQKQLDQAQKDKQTALGMQQKHIDLEVQKLAQSAKQATDHLALQTKEFALKAEQPVHIGDRMDDYGNRVGVFAKRDPQTGDYHPIDLETGKVTGKPIPASKVPDPQPVAPAAPGAPTSSAAPPAPVATRGFEPRVDTATPAPDVKPLTPAELEDQQREALMLPPGLSPPQPARNDDFLKRLPPGMAATVKGLADYEVDPTSLSIKGGHREQLIGMTRQFDPTYDQTLYPAKKRAVTEFYAGGPSSPAGVLTAGNKAILHGAEMSDALEKMKAQGSGILNYVGQSGIPWLSYQAQKLHNAGVPGTGTPEAVSMSEFNTARQRFSEEVTKFYAGSQGAQAEREHALALIDSAKSLPELRAAISQDMKLMKDQVTTYQSRLMTAMGPAAWKSAVLRDPNSVLLYKSSQEAFDKIHKRAQGDGAPAPGATPAASAPARSPADQQAIDWAGQHPNDPRSAEIKRRLGVQ